MFEGNILLLIAVLWPLCGALLSYIIGRKSKNARDFFAGGVGITEFLLLAGLLLTVLRGAEYELRVAFLLERGLHFRLDGFRALYGTIAAFMWMMTTIYSRDYLRHYRNRNRYYLFTLLTCGATVGVFLSDDLYTTFLFFEIMSFTSYVMVIHDEKPGAMRAGQTYLAVALLGGMVLLGGMFLLEHLTGTLEMEELLSACARVSDRRLLYLAGSMLLFGFAAKAGMYPLHIWLPKAHPVAPAPASALLSGILTKAGVFGVLAVSCNLFPHDRNWGAAILAFGTVTMLLGAVIAVFSIDLKRTLACSSMSQIGFILVGVGMQGLLGEENALAVWGTVLHMVNHSLIKLALFMAAGVVYQNLHKLDLNDIRGFGRGKPVLLFVFLMGYLGIIGMPLWNGYVSKTLLHESIVEYIELMEASGSPAGVFQIVEWVFLISGGLTAAYMTKLLVALFVERHPTEQARMEACNGNYMRPASVFALCGAAALLPLLGFFPGVLMNGIARLGQGFLHGTAPAHEISYFSWTNLRGALISLGIGAAVYLGIIRTLLMRNGIYVNRWPGKLDLEDGLYRPVLRAAVFVLALLCRLISVFPEGCIRLLNASVLRPVRRPAAEEKPDPLEADMPRELKKITAGLSFGMLLFGAGFCVLMLYLFVTLLLP